MATANPDDFEVLPTKPAYANPNDFEVIGSANAAQGPQSTSLAAQVSASAADARPEVTADISPPESGTIVNPYMQRGRGSESQPLAPTLLPPTTPEDEEAAIKAADDYRESRERAKLEGEQRIKTPLMNLPRPAASDTSARAGIITGAEQAAEGFTTPESLAILLGTGVVAGAGGPLGKVVGQGVGYGFAATMLKDVPDKLAAGWNAPTPRERWATWTGAALDMAMAAGILGHRPGSTKAQEVLRSQGMPQATVDALFKSIQDNGPAALRNASDATIDAFVKDKALRKSSGFPEHLIENEVARRAAMHVVPPTEAATPPARAPAEEIPPSEAPQVPSGEIVSPAKIGGRSSLFQQAKADALRAAITPEAKELAPATAAATEKVATAIETTPPQPVGPATPTQSAERKAPAEETPAPKQEADAETPQSQETPGGPTLPATDLTPAIKTPDGTLTGENHPAIIETHGLDPAVRESPASGFVDEAGNFHSREATADALEKQGIETAKPGEAHTSDIPKAREATKEDADIDAAADELEKQLGPEEEEAPQPPPETTKRAADMTKEEKLARMENDLAAARKAGNTRAAKDIRARIKALSEEPKQTQQAQTEEAPPKQIWKKTRDEIKAEGGQLARHRLEVKAAVQNGEPVPLDVLEGFAGSKWADDAIAKNFGGEASDSLLDKLLKSIEDDPTKLYADPLLLKTAFDNLGKPAIRGAVKAFRAAREGGMLAKDALEDAITYLKSNVKDWTPEKEKIARALFQKETKEGGDLVESTQEKNDEEKGSEQRVLTPAAESGEVPPSSPEAEIPSEPIGIQNAVTDALRDKYGVGERDAVIRRTFGAAKAEADAAFADNPFAGRDLVDALKKETRPLTDKEDAILTIELARRKNEYERSLDDKNPQKKALADYLEMIPVAENVGTANARGLNARKMMINSDYTLAGIARRVYRERGRPLEPDEIKKVGEQAKAVAEKEKAVAEKMEAEKQRDEAQEASRVYEQTIADLKSELTKKGKAAKEPIEKRLSKPISESIIQKADNAIAAAKERLSKVNWKTLLGGESGGVGGVGGGPTGRKLGAAEESPQLHQVISDLATIGAGHLIKGAILFPKWSKIMLDELGDGIKPHLRTIFDASKREAAKMLDSKEKTPQQIKSQAKAEAVSGEALSHKTVYDLARAHINSGVRGEDAVMAAVHSDIKEAYPDATERDVRRAFSEYGKAKFPSKDAVKKELAEIRTLTLLQESIERETEGLPALKTGLQRDKATQSIREKQKQLNELLKARKGPPSPEQLTTRDQAKQTALRNAIADLDKQLRTGEKPLERTPTTDSPATEQLRAERDAMVEKLKEIEAAQNPPKSPADKQLEELGKRKQRVDDILSGKLDPAKPAAKPLLSSAAESIQAEIHAMQELAAQMRRDAKPKSDPGAKAEEQKIATLEKSIERYAQKTANKDFTTLGKKLGPDSLRVSQLKEIRDSRRSMYEAQEKPANPPKTPDEIYNARRMKEIAKRTAELEAQRAELASTRQITPKPKPAKKFAFPETAKADAELTQLKKDIDNEIGRIKYEDRSPAQKTLDAFVSGWKAITAATITGHGTTGMGTHAGGVAFRPTEATRYWRNFGRQFGMWANKSFHDELIFRLKNNPLYETAKSAGLAVDPDKTYTDYSMYAKWLENPPKALGKPGKLAAAFIKSGERGFDALKMQRMEMFESEMNNLSPELKADPETAKLIADMTNKATGAIPRTSPIEPSGANLLDRKENQLYNMAKNGISDTVLFAPRLLASRWMRATFDPVKTVYTFANWSNESPAARRVATIKARHAAEFVATYAGALLINQALLSASGSKQAVNFNNPAEPDWLKFKGFDKIVTADGGLLDPIRLIGQIVLADIIHDMDASEEFRYSDSKFLKVGDRLLKYARGKANPTFGLIIDATTGKDFTGRPLPFDLPSLVTGKNPPTQTAKEERYHPKYTWKEWIAQHGPIPISGGTKVVYDQLRKSGRTDAEAKDIIAGAVATAFEMTGEKISEDNPRRLKATRH